jgi:hypothetical protein
MYPGLPVMLAGIQKLLGEGSLAPLILMYGVAAMTLVLTDRLVRLGTRATLKNPHPGPPPEYRGRGQSVGECATAWVSVAVVSLLGFNSFFLEHANEILTDLPFLLGVVMALYGFEKLTAAPGPQRRLMGAVAMVFGGLLVAASMRPTFWFVALAWAATSIAGRTTARSSKPTRRGRRCASPRWCGGTRRWAR